MLFPPLCPFLLPNGCSGDGSLPSCTVQSWERPRDDQTTEWEELGFLAVGAVIPTLQFLYPDYFEINLILFKLLLFLLHEPKVHPNEYYLYI